MNSVHIREAYIWQNKKGINITKDYNTRYTMCKQEGAKIKDIPVTSNSLHCTLAYLILQPQEVFVLREVACNMFILSV